MGDAERGEWISSYLVNRSGRVLIVHAYEVAGEQWKQGYQIFLQGEGENNFKSLFESERVYYKRKNALEAGKLDAETRNFRFEEEASNLEVVLS